MGGGDIEKREEENGPHRGVGMEEAVQYMEVGKKKKKREKGKTRRSI